MRSRCGQNALLAILLSPLSATAQSQDPLAAAHMHVAACRYELAEREALAAIRTNPSTEAFLLLAVASMRLNQLNESIGWLEQAVRRSPGNAEVYKILGLDYALGGMLPEAAAAFARAAALAPTNWEHYYLGGRTLFELGRNLESRDRLRESVRLNPSSPRAWTALGQAREKLGERAAAEECYARALRVCAAGGECAWPLLQLGFMHGLEGGPAAAIPYYRKAVAARPDWARAHFHLGKALAAADDLPAARKELAEAVRLDGAQPEYHYQLAGVYRRLGDSRKAAAHLTRFRSLRQWPAKSPASVEVGQP